MVVQKEPEILPEENKASGSGQQSGTLLSPFYIQLLSLTYILAELDSDEEIIDVCTVAADTQRKRTLSVNSQISMVSSVNGNKRRKRIFEEDEELNPATFKMADLIDWKPRVENTLRTKWKEMEKKFKEEGFAVKQEKQEKQETDIGPKVGNFFLFLIYI